MNSGESKHTEQRTYFRDYTSEFATNHKARTMQRSREDLIPFIFKPEQFPYPFVKLNHFFSYNNSPRDSDNGGQ